jgi:prophage tail gpP-like protein
VVNHDVRIIVGGQAYERCWTNFEIDQDVRKWPSSWRLTAQPVRSQIVQDLRAAVRDAAEVQVHVDGTTVSTGRILDIESGVDRTKGSYVNVSGGGCMAPSTKSCVALGQSLGGLTIKDAIEQKLAPWMVEVIGSNATNRAACTMRTVRTQIPGQSDVTYTRTVDGGATHVNYQEAGEPTSRVTQVPDDRKVVARPGETAADWVRRFVAQSNLLCWETARGQLFVGLPNYELPPLLTVVVPETPDTVDPTEGQVVSSKLVERPGDQATEVQVTGRVGRAGATRVSATVYDTDLFDRGWYSTRIVTDDQLRDQAKAQAKANQILWAEQLESYVYEVTIAGHGVGRALPAIDTMVNVRDPICGVNETLWCAARRFSYSRDQGATVTLTLVRPGLWVVES